MLKTFTVSAVLAVVVLVITLLLYREDTRNRLIRLAGRGRLTVTTRALDEAGRLRLAAALERYVLTLPDNPLSGHPERLPLELIGGFESAVGGLATDPRDESFETRFATGGRHL